MFEFVNAGLDPNFVDYMAAWELQKTIHSEVVAGTRGNTVLLLEHPPVYTAGKRTEAHERPTDGTPVIDVDRGGKITWHGPGQLVGYPIARLPQPIDVVAYVRWLEQVLIDLTASFGLHTERVEGRTGIWSPTPDGHVKIGAIGIRVAERVTMHGFALNCNNSLEAYDHIIACGITDARTSTMTDLLGVEVTPAQAAERLPLYMGELPRRNK